MRHIFKFAIILAFLLASFSTVGAAEQKKIGLGLIVGEPTGLTAKYMMDDTRGIDAGIGWETSGDNEFHVYGDYLYHLNNFINESKESLLFFFGAGVRYIDREKKDDKLGVRIPVGIEYLFDAAPVKAFFELVPVLNLTPDTDFDLEAGIGIRYFF